MGYALELPVDASMFAAEVASATDATAGRRVEILGRALRRWNGDAIEEFAGESWVLGEAARLVALRSQAVEELASLLIEARRTDEAIAWLEPHLARHPVADRPRLLLMRALAASGRQTEALRVFQTYRGELGEQVGLDPGPELVLAEQRIALGWNGIERAGVDESVVRPERTVDRLPSPSTRWIGSMDTIERVAAALGSHRVVTLTGPGGVGKTRTAVEFARAHLHRYPDGVVMVEFASIDRTEMVADAVATTLQVTQRGEASVIESILDRLAGARSLLVLDNCEHVLDGAAEVAAAVAARSATVDVLVTSREPLRVDGERVLAVRPLAVDDGIGLFCDRASAADDTARFDDGELAAVREICGRLDGLPLAVELAAARARSLAPSDLLRRLGRRFDALGVVRGQGSHHGTLFATIDWSYRLLRDVEQHLFDQLSVFHGPFDLDAVTAVCVASPNEQDTAPDVVLALSALVDKSMVTTVRTGGDLRYQLLDSLREFGADRLAARGGTAAAEERHRRHFVSLAERTGRDWLGPDQARAGRRLDGSWDDLRAAHASALRHGDQPAASRLLLATLPYAQLHMRSEHGSWCAATVAHDPDRVSPELLGWAAWWAMIAGEHDRAIEWTSTGIARAGAGAGRDEVGLAVCHSIAAFSWWARGRRDEANEHAAVLEHLAGRLEPWYAYTAHRALFSFADRDRFEPIAERIASIVAGIGAPSLIASARFYQGSAKMSGGADAVSAAALHLEGVGLARGSGTTLAECQNLQGLLDARVALARSGMTDPAEVAAECADTLRRLHELRYWLYLWRVLDGAAWVLASSGEIDRAHELLRALEAQGRPWRTEPRASTRALLADVVDGEVGRSGNHPPIEREQLVVLALEGLERVASR
jgi:predicted ATPase